LKNGSVQTRRVFIVYQIGEMFGNACKEAATGATATNGFLATSLFPCDKNTFRRHDFPLVSGNTDALPVNHPALVKNSDQLSLSSSNFSPFTSVEVLRASDISSVPSLNLKPKPRDGTAKKITSSTYKNLLRQLKKRKSNRPLNPKPNERVECSSWSLKKTG
jgi:hypothetical protein